MLQIINDLLFGVFLLGITFIYVPQFYVFYQSKSSYGFNYWFLFLGYMASFISWLNAGIHYLNNWQHCQGWTPCFESIFGFILLIYQWLMFLIFYILFLYYYPFDSINQSVYGPLLSQIETLSNGEQRVNEQAPNTYLSTTESEETGETRETNCLVEGQISHCFVGLEEKNNFLPTSDQWPPTANSQSELDGLLSTASIHTDLNWSAGFKQAQVKKNNVWYRSKKFWTWTTFWLGQIIGLVVAGVNGMLLGINHWSGDDSDWFALRIWSDLLGVLISVLIISHYLPQIWEIWRIKKKGSMSLLTLGLMIIGTFVWSYFLATQPNIDPKNRVGEPSIWVPYILVGIMQIILLILAGYYYQKNIRFQKKWLWAPTNVADDPETF